MKSFLILTALCLLTISTSYRLRSRGRESNENSEVMFSASSSGAPETKTTVLTSIFKARPIKVKSTMRNQGDIVKREPENLRFKESQVPKGFDSTNLEAPQIVKSLGPDPSPFGRAASKSEQNISNKQAYDSIYPSHKSWYNEKKFIVIDKNFEMMEKELLGKFKENLDAKFDFQKTKNVKHVDELDQHDIKISGMDFGSMHKIHPDTVAVKDKYVDNFSATKKPTVTASDPYGEIFGGRYSG